MSIAAIHRSKDKKSAAFSQPFVKRREQEEQRIAQLPSLHIFIQRCLQNGSLRLHGINRKAGENMTGT